MLEVIIYGLIAGCAGTTIGGIIGILLPKSKKIYLLTLEFASGLMISIVSFSLLPNAIEMCNIWICLIAYFSGAIIILLTDKFIKNNNKQTNKEYILGIMILVSISLHNFPEGLAIGSGFSASTALGMGLFVAIALHDIPEGISISMPLCNSKNMSKIKMVYYTFLSGVPTGIGAGIGYGIGNISDIVIGVCMSLAGGVMMCVVVNDMLPESNKESKTNVITIANLVGFALGTIFTYFE